MFTRQNGILFLGTLLCLFVLFFLIVHPTTAPWTASGRLLLAVRSVPETSENDVHLLLGIDDVELIASDGTSKTVTVLTRRITLNPQSSDIELVLDTNVPVGDYVGFRFKLTSPELRNPWQEEEAPQYISLAHDLIQLETPYRIEENVTSAIVLSFETLQAIHVEGTTQVYLPVVQMETRSHTTLLQGEGEYIQLEGGEIQNSVTYGMDWDGRMRFNFRAQPKETEQSIETEPEPQPAEEVEIETSIDGEDMSSTTATTSLETVPVFEEVPDDPLL